MAKNDQLKVYDYESEQIRRKLRNLIDSEKLKYERNLPSFKNIIQEYLKEEDEFRTNHKSISLKAYLIWLAAAVLNLAVILMVGYIGIKLNSNIVKALSGVFLVAGVLINYFIYKLKNVKRKVTLADVVEQLKEEDTEIHDYLKDNFGEFLKVDCDKFLNVMDQEIYGECINSRKTNNY